MPSPALFVTAFIILGFLLILLVLLFINYLSKRKIRKEVNKIYGSVNKETNSPETSRENTGNVSIATTGGRDNSIRTDTGRSNSAGESNRYVAKPVGDGESASIQHANTIDNAGNTNSPQRIEQDKPKFKLHKPTTL